MTTLTATSKLNTFIENVNRDGLTVAEKALYDIDGDDDVDTQDLKWAIDTNDDDTITNDEIKKFINIMKPTTTSHGTNATKEPTLTQQNVTNIAKIKIILKNANMAGKIGDKDEAITNKEIADVFSVTNNNGKISSDGIVSNWDMKNLSQAAKDAKKDILTKEDIYTINALDQNKNALTVIDTKQFVRNYRWYGDDTVNNLDHNKDALTATNTKKLIKKYDWYGNAR